MSRPRKGSSSMLRWEALAKAPGAEEDRGGGGEGAAAAAAAGVAVMTAEVVLSVLRSQRSPRPDRRTRRLQK